MINRTNQQHYTVTRLKLRKIDLNHPNTWHRFRAFQTTWEFSLVRLITLFPLKPHRHLFSQSEYLIESVWGDPRYLLMIYYVLPALSLGPLCSPSPYLPVIVDSLVSGWRKRTRSGCYSILLTILLVITVKKSIVSTSSLCSVWIPPSSDWTTALTWSILNVSSFLFFCFCSSRSWACLSCE